MNICIHCGKVYKPKRRGKQGRNQKYCSIKCVSEAKTVLEKRECPICGKFFKPRRKTTTFCSQSCGNTRGGIVEKECLHCGKKFKAARYRNRKFCSGYCKGKYHTGEKHPRWKGGFLTHNGYKKILVNGAPILEHRFIWEKYNGKLPKEIIIHHKDGNKLNNEIGNLMATTRSEHAKLHHILRNCE